MSHPLDWIKEVERKIIQLVPSYNLTTLDEADVFRVLDYYYWDLRMSLKKAEQLPDSEYIKVGGKLCKKISAEDATWL